MLRDQILIESVGGEPDTVTLRLQPLAHRHEGLHVAVGADDQDGDVELRGLQPAGGRASTQPALRGKQLARRENSSISAFLQL